MVLMRILKIFFLINILINYSSNVMAIEPKDFVQLTVNKASEALTKDYMKEEKIKKLKIIASDTVDIKGIGFYTLGAHRKNLSISQKEEYIILFKEYFLITFASRLAQYTDPKIKVDGQKVLNENYTMVYSTLIATNKRPEVKINWRIYTKNLNNLMIRDLIIEGLSLARTQKEEFNSIIQSNNNDINSLFLRLTEFNNK
jgi:phospholipid transport system substrate-binding protein